MVKKVLEVLFFLEVKPECCCLPRPQVAGINIYNDVFYILWIGNVANFQYQVKFVNFEDRGRM